ncbi:MAG: sigma factor-like helix-turn-helix DNA-binding protein, partial [Brevibacterium aurantiacum]
RRRFGWNGEPPQTLDAIGNRFAVTRERIRQLEKKSIEKLKEQFEAHSFFAETHLPMPKKSMAATLTSDSTLQTAGDDPQPTECDK